MLILTVFTPKANKSVCEEKKTVCKFKLIKTVSHRHKQV